MNSIGGYFELELIKGPEYYTEAIKVNSGRNAFEYIILANKYAKIYIPYFTCDVLLEPLKRNNISFEFYKINLDLEPIFDFAKIGKNEAFLYTNYFGIKDDYTLFLANSYDNIIIDNAQSFYSLPINNTDTFYSPRKFFGLPDGGYVYSKTKLNTELKKDEDSINRMSHLLKRLAFNAESGYEDFIKNDNSLINNKLKSMSSLTESLLQSINYKAIATKRIENFDYISNEMKNLNLLNINKLPSQVPMVYPLKLKNGNIKNKLIENRIYIPTYWPNVKKWVEKNSIEYELCDTLVHIPIDQRYDKVNLNRIIKIIFDNV